MITILAIIAFDFLVLGVPVQLCHWPVRILAIVMSSDVPSFMAVQQAIRGMNSFSDGRSFVYSGRRDSGNRKASKRMDFAGPVSQLRGGLGMVSVMANMILPEYQDRELP